jgi:hypothetical protein
LLSSLSMQAREITLCRLYTHIIKIIVRHSN